MFKFIGPFTMTITGQTGCGKTSWVRKLFKHKKEMFSPEPTEIMYCYGIYQQAYDEMQHEMPFIKFHSGLPTESEIKEFADGTHKMICCDDLMNEMSKSADMLKLIVQVSHHCNISALSLSQNLYCPGKYSRTMNLNTHYLVVLRNPRDVSTMKVLGRQLGIGNAVYEAYMDAHKEPFSYLVINMSPYGDNEHKLLTKIFPGEDTVVYKV